MKQIAVLSGKGGTGKTFVAASLSWIAENSVAADCDVDASNLHLLLQPTIRKTHAFSGGSVAHIERDRCIGCGDCVDHCRFEALSMAHSVAVVDAIACEGCGVCAFVCPVDAPVLAEQRSGSWYESDGPRGPMVHARLDPGEENSGKLVELVRRAAHEHAVTAGAAWVIIDGPPGTGCAAKSAVTGVDFAVLVTEPTVSGVHDLKRIASLLEFFSVPGGLVVNKSTIHPATTNSIRELAVELELEWLGEIPFSRSVAESVAALTPYTASHENEISERIAEIWGKIRTR
jgi:MinD superfamily P-loop ATPase